MNEFLYMVTSNNISRPVHNPHDQPATLPTPRIDAYANDQHLLIDLWSSRERT